MNIKRLTSVNNSSWCNTSGRIKIKKSLTTLALFCTFSSAFAAAPAYVALYGLNLDSNLLSTTLQQDNHVNAINAGFILLKTQTSCNIQNISDGSLNNPLASSHIADIQKFISDQLYAKLSNINNNKNVFQNLTQSITSVKRVALMNDGANSSWVKDTRTSKYRPRMLPNAAFSMIIPYSSVDGWVQKE